VEDAVADLRAAISSIGLEGSLGDSAAGVQAAVAGVRTAVDDVFADVGC
jgi:hypothetical protein